MKAHKYNPHNDDFTVTITPAELETWQAWTTTHQQLLLKILNLTDIGEAQYQQNALTLKQMEDLLAKRAEVQSAKAQKNNPSE